MDTDGGPQADDGGEQELIIRTSFILSGAHQATQVSDDWWLIGVSGTERLAYHSVAAGCLMSLCPLFFPWSTQMNTDFFFRVFCVFRGKIDSMKFIMSPI